MPDPKVLEELHRNAAHYRANKANLAVAAENLPKEDARVLRDGMDIFEYLYEIYEPWISAIEAPLQALAEVHYPVLAPQMSHPVYKRHLSEAHIYQAGALMEEAYRLVRKSAQGIPAETDYARELHSWESNLYQIHGPKLYGDEDRKEFSTIPMPDDEWAGAKARLNEEAWQHYRWYETRYNTWANIVQPELLRYLPEIEQLDGDYWKVYAIMLHTYYSLWKSTCDRIQTNVAYGLAPETMDLPYQEWQAAFNRAAYEKETAEERLSGQ